MERLNNLLKALPPPGARTEIWRQVCPHCHSSFGVTAASSASPIWHLGKLHFSPRPSCHFDRNSPLQTDDRIHLFGGFVSGITVWETDARAGGRAPNRSQPAGAMQAWIRDGQHEQHQVLGTQPPYGSAPWAARERKLRGLSSLYKPGSGNGTFSQMLEGNCNQSALRCSKGVWNGLIGTWNPFNKINTCPKCKWCIILHKGRVCM